MFFGTFWEHHTCHYIYHTLIIKYLNTILCYSEENELKLHIYGDVLEVQGTESGISIYAITGGKMAESKSNRIDISRLPAGIYLLNTARGSIKFIHK